MKKILIEISFGELLDKLSILEIKREKITRNESLKLIEKEYKILEKIYKETLGIEKFEKFYKELKKINLKLWDIENEKRGCEKEKNFGEKFIKLSRDVHFMNDKRAMVKLNINKISGSNIEEVKEYTKY
tara:strand:- start:974 stop:1360 length:387 start_codon:yes stop_codon:yes gene_type:complete